MQASCTDDQDALGAQMPDVLRLRLADRSALRWLAQGRIGHIADAYVRGLLDIDGTMPDVMKVAGDLAGDPLPETLLQLAKDGDVVVTMGAGSISNVPAQLVQMTAQGKV